MRSAAVDPQRLAELLAATADGDQNALVALYDATSPILYGLLLRMLKQPEWAQEALQDCYMRVWRRSGTYSRDKGDPIGWLIGIARYRALDLLRTQRHGLDLLDDGQMALQQAVDQGPTPEDRAVEQEGLRRLSRCMDALQDDQRRSVLLAYYEGYSHQELAQVMNAPLGTVKAWVRRGLARLRECLAQ